jgi:hypothetical protein
MNLARILPALLLLAGCTSVKSSLKEPLPAPLAAGKGVVLFSTGAPEGSYVNVYGLSLTSVSKAGDTSNLSTDILINRGYDTSDFPDEHGQVRMVVLDEGAYCFYPRVLNPYMTLKGRIPQLAFHVKGGAVTYIGSLFMEGMSFTVRNKEARDLEKALATRPELEKMPRATQLARNLGKCTASF